MKHSSWSLRNRLIALLAALAFLAWCASSFWLYRAAEKQAGELFDAALVEAAYAVFAVVAHEGLGKDDDFDFEPEEHAHVEKMFYQLRDRSGTIRYSSPGTPPAALADEAASGFTEGTVEGAVYRVFTLQEPRRRGAIHVGQRLADREALVRSVALRLLLPGVVVVFLLALGVWVIVQRVTAPVIAYSKAIDERAPADSGSVVADNLPSELQPVGHAVNRLLERVEAALVRERTLTADAAHELRTPLAVLRAQAQVALRSRDDSERHESLQALISGVDRATRLVETVLTLARLDARAIDRSTLPVVALNRVAAEVIASLDASVRARSLQLEIDVSDISLKADPDSLPVALRNLAENAIRHAASRVRIEARSAADRITITVLDDGPGMTVEQQLRAFDRFYRGTNDSAGAGLGLALAKRVADMHGGSVRFVTGIDGRGLGVEMELPKTAA